MKLLVTGGAGFIGSNFIRYWLDRHERDFVVNLDLLTYAGDRESLRDVEERHGPRYTFVYGDIADDQTVEAVFGESKPDVVVNFAAESHNSRAVVDPQRFVRTNTLGTQILLEASRRHRVSRFHHVSTCEVYGDLSLDSAEAFSEESPYRPRTPYNASKAGADHLVRAYQATYGLPTTISNSANNYGPWQHPEKLIPLFATRALDGQSLPLYQHSANRREWLHVDDHCRAIECILQSGHEGATYNVGSGDEHSIEEIADLVLEMLGKPSSLKQYVQDRPGHDRRYLLDHTKIQRELSWSARVEFRPGLKDTIDWYRSHREWWNTKKIGAETALDEFSWGPKSVESRG